MVALLKNLRRRYQEQTEEMRMQGMDQYDSYYQFEILTQKL